MFRYGKLTRQAVSAITYLAQLHGENSTAVSSRQVAQARRLSPSLAAKLLSEMATAGLLKGSPGPGGGYQLARPPESIHLGEIVRLFERGQEDSACPFGPGWCGHGAPCPLHDPFARMQARVDEFLTNTTLAGFASLGPEPGSFDPRPSSRAVRKSRKG